MTIWHVIIRILKHKTHDSYCTLRRVQYHTTIFLERSSRDVRGTKFYLK